MRRLLFTATALLLPHGLSAEPGLPSADAVTAALDAHPSVMAAQSRIAAADAAAGALARGSHEIVVSGSYIRRSVDREGGFDEYDAQATRALRLPGKARLDREIGAFGLAVARNNAEDVRHQAARLLSDIWWEWLGAAEEARVDRQAVENYRKLLEAVRLRVSQHDAAQLEADQAEALLGSARLAAEQSEGRENVARSRLAAQFPTLPLDVDPPAVPRPVLPEKGLEMLAGLVIERSHEIAAADALAGRASASASRARAERIADPSLGVRAFSERDGAERGAGLMLSIPLGGGHRKAIADQAEAEAVAARAEAGATRFAVEEMARTDEAEARFRLAAWQRAREGLDAQVAALGKLRLGYRSGEVDLADELLGERQVHDAFRAEAQARTEAMRALTRMRIDSHELWIGEETP